MPIPVFLYPSLSCNREREKSIAFAAHVDDKKINPFHNVLKRKITRWSETPNQSTIFHLLKNPSHSLFSSFSDLIVPQSLGSFSLFFNLLANQQKFLPFLPFQFLYLPFWNFYSISTNCL